LQSTEQCKQEKYDKAAYFAKFFLCILKLGCRFRQLRLCRIQIAFQLLDLLL